MRKSFITISVLIVAIDLQWVYHLTCDKPKAAPYRYLFNNTSRQHENLLPSCPKQFRHTPLPVSHLD